MKKTKQLKKNKEFLYNYLNAYSPVAQETEGQKIWEDYVRPLVDGNVKTDAYGTSYAVYRGKTKSGQTLEPWTPKVVIEAHADEISWFVHYITKDGFIYLRRNGGSDHQIAPSKRVNIHTDKGIVKAFFGWPAIHVREPGKEESPSVRNIFLDCGAASQKEVEKLKK